MGPVDGRSWMRIVAKRSAVAECLRAGNRYAQYSHYAALLAAAIWLFAQLPVGTDAMAVIMGSSLWRLVACGLCVAGSALACALALIGVWQPGRVNQALSALALALCCLP